ncbi:AbrB/MazE/SpoVT family DNA-binding domain-containing protein [bacterium AH-315-I18]|nr:AbrB/MazE/SpoVT family DNA-binding domain-containing protein [Phycisphaeraceae bacterium]MBN4061108.1 AbrB/MazE/SpoVT family DNA-binding domain-containing protein [bacterium AH-315-I18]
MSKATVSSKGQITIPRRFRERMSLTDQRQVEMEQLDDGAVIIRPIRSIMHLAGQIKINKPLLSVTEERKIAQQAMAQRHKRKGQK